jgi:hypothetical protein
VLNGKNKDHLIGFGEAIRRCEEGCDGRSLVLSADERRSIANLKKLLRDDFEHFHPRASSIELHGITSLALDCIRVIEYLAMTGWVRVRLNDDRQERIKSAATEARKLLLNSPLHLDLQPVTPLVTLASQSEQSNLAT